MPASCGHGLSAIHGAATKLGKEMSRLAAWALKAKEKDPGIWRWRAGPEVRTALRENPSTMGAREHRERE